MRKLKCDQLKMTIYSFVQNFKKWSHAQLGGRFVTCLCFWHSKLGSSRLVTSRQVSTEIAANKLRRSEMLCSVWKRPNSVKIAFELYCRCDRIFGVLTAEFKSHDDRRIKAGLPAYCGHTLKIVGCSRYSKYRVQMR